MGSGERIQSRTDEAKPEFAVALVSATELGLFGPNEILTIFFFSKSYELGQFTTFIRGKVERTVL